MSAKNVRIKDIARLAGVSVGTVDRVLHSRGRVSDGALKKVLSVLDQIDYKPNVIARTLGANRTYRIAALIPDPAQDPYWASSRDGIDQGQSEWTRYGVSIVSYYFDLYHKNSFGRVAQAILADPPDGILIAPIFLHETLPYFEKFAAAGVPFVLFNSNIEQAASLSFIGQDLFQSGRVGGELMHLALRGTTGSLAVVHINEDPENSVHLASKEKGFREYFSTTHMGIRALNLKTASDDALRDSITTLLRDEGLKGIFVTTSKGTYQVAAIVAGSGRKDVRIVGYDMLAENIRYLKQEVISFLIHQNPRQQAFLGIHHLVAHLVLKKQTPARELLPLEIISPGNVNSYLESANPHVR